MLYIHSFIGGESLLPISINTQGSKPLYQQIIDQVHNLILSGRLPPEAPLPSVRKLAQELAVSVITTRRAYDELEQAGLIYTRPGMGSFVVQRTTAQRHAAQKEHVRSLLREAIDEAARLGLSPDQVQLLLAQLLAEDPR
mgnify:CR=1 FL=1